MAEGALRRLVEEVKDAVIVYNDVTGGAGYELQQLEKEVGVLKELIGDVHRMRKWREEDNLLIIDQLENRVKEVVYQVEDSIASCLFRAAEEKAKKIAIRPSFIGRHNLSLAKEVKILREEMVKPLLDDAKRVFAQMEIINAHQPTPTMIQESPPKLKKGRSIRQDKPLVGFDDAQELIMCYIMEERVQGLEVFSIIGVPGLGKTTVAWKIFNDETIGFAFPTRIWINVSQMFNRRNVYLNIMKRFTRQDMSSLDDEELIEAVRSSLEKQMFLLVLDDVWDVKDFDAIKMALPHRNGGGKVLLTSRDMSVGRYANIIRQPYRLRFLTQDESWELLQLEVFGNLGVCPPELEGVGIQIANSCDGLPLMIMVMGGILSDLHLKAQAVCMVKNEWENAYMELHLHGEGKERIIWDAIAFSYNRLPYDLRECFLYMGVFPEDDAIPTWTVTRLWIAEGFIQPRNGNSLEETADEILYDLISRNLLTVDKLNPMGEVKTCRVHDMIRQFCITKAAEHNLFREIKSKTAGIFDPSVSEVERYHRLSLHSNISEFFSARPEGPRVRSLLCFNKEPLNLDPTYISAIPNAFPLLRVLDSKVIKFHQFPARVAKLFHLRYITLCIDILAALPEPIALIWNLQTLVIETKSRSITMKANIWKMIRLRHFKTKAAIILDNEWEGQGGENLQTISRLSPECCTQALTRRASNLKTLGICGKSASIFSTQHLEKLHCLEKLKLVNDLRDAEDMVRGLPQRNFFPPHLRRLTLANTFLEWRHMSTLAMIQKLEVLKLKDNAFDGSSWDAIGYSLPSLNLLLITNTNLVIWSASPNSFPSLRCVVLRNCENLEEIPVCLCEVEYFQRLEIERLRSSAVQSAKKIHATKRGCQFPFKLTVGPGCQN